MTFISLKTKKNWIFKMLITFYGGHRGTFSFKYLYLGIFLRRKNVIWNVEIKV